VEPSKNEGEYVWVQEWQQRIAKLEEEQQVESEVDKLRLKETDWMQYPKCDQKLSTEKCGSVEIDVWPPGPWKGMGFSFWLVAPRSG